MPWSSFIWKKSITLCRTKTLLQLLKIITQHKKEFSVFPKFSTKKMPFSFPPRFSLGANQAETLNIGSHCTCWWRLVLRGSHRRHCSRGFLLVVVTQVRFAGVAVPARQRLTTRKAQDKSGSTSLELVSFECNSVTLRPFGLKYGAKSRKAWVEPLPPPQKNKA